LPLPQALAFFVPMAVSSYSLAPISRLVPSCAGGCLFFARDASFFCRWLFFLTDFAPICLLVPPYAGSTYFRCTAKVGKGVPKREGPPVAARGPSLSGRSHLLGRVGRKALFISEGLICLLADQSSGQPAADADFDTLADCKVLSVWSLSPRYRPRASPAPDASNARLPLSSLLKHFLFCTGQLT